MNMKYLTGISILLVFLIVSMPFCFAAEMQLTYDANGNLVTGDGKFRTYNSLNQLWKVYNGSNSSGTLLEEYMYHPTEERVWTKKVYNSSGTVVETTFYINQNLVLIKNISGIYSYTYIYHEGQLVAQVNPDGSKLYFATDIKGDIVATMNSTGNVTENNLYSPTGEITSGGNKSRYNYEGKEYDKTTGQTDYNARMLLGPQFIQPDTLISNAYAPQSLNRCSFEDNNPYKNTDPTGHLILGAQGAAEGAAGSGGGGSLGGIADFHMDGTYTAYYFTSTTVGGGEGASASIEGIYGLWTTIDDFEGKGLTGQGGFTPTGSVGFGLTGSGNMPLDKNGRLKWSKGYSTLGAGGAVGIGGIQVYGGETNTNPTYLYTGKWNPLASDKSLEIREREDIKKYVKDSPDYQKATHSLNTNSGCTSTQRSDGSYSYKC